MSFPRANIKRFNEEIGCAPPPGFYDPKLGDRAHGGVVDKSDRFKTPKVEASVVPLIGRYAPPPGFYDPKLIDRDKLCERFKTPKDVADSSIAKTPVKQLFAAPQNSKKVKATSSVTNFDPSRIKELEKEIRRLLKEQGDKDRLLAQKETEFKKKDGLTYKENAHLKEELSQAISHMLADLQKLDGHVVALEGHVNAYNELVSLVLKQNSDKVASNKKKEEGIPIDELSQKLKDDKLSVETKLKLIKRKSESLQTRYSKALEDLNQGTKQLKSRYTSILEENAKMLKEVTELQDRLQEAVNMRTSLEEHRDNLLNSNTNLQDQVKQLSAEQKNTTDSISALSQTVVEREASLATLQSKFDELKNLHESECKESRDRLQQLEDRDIVVNETTSSLHERLVELQAQNEDLAATLEETGSLLSKTQGENDKLEEMLRQAELNWESEKKQFLIQVEELVFEKSRADSIIGDAENKVKELEECLLTQKSQSEDQIQALNLQLEGEKAELMQLQNKLGDLVYEKFQLHFKVGHLEAQLKLVRVESEETAVEANRALDVIPGLKQRIETLSNEKSNVEKQAAVLVAQNETLQVSLERFQADFDEYSKNVTSERMETQSKIVSLTEEIDGLREQKDRMAKELDDWLTEKSELDIEVAKLQCRIKVLEMESEQVNEETKKELEACKGEIERVTKEKQEMEKDMEQYGIDLLSNAAQLQSLQASLDGKQSELDTLEQETQLLRTNVETLKTALEGKETYISKLQTSYDEKCTACERLTSDKARLLEDLQTQKEACEDLDCRLQQTRADFLKRCDERDELIRKNEAKDQSLAIMSQQVSELTQQLEQLNCSLSLKSTECDQVMAKYTEQEKEVALSAQQVSNYKQQIEDYKEHLQLKCDECDELQQKCEDYNVELTMSAQEIVDLQEAVTSLKRVKELVEAERSDGVAKYEEEIQSLKEQLKGAASNEEMQAELDKYRRLYEDLLAKVEPFMEQIDNYEMEKQLLLGKNKNTQAEMERLGRDFAQLLGHQNNKQKIKHIVKIKEENNALKEENQKLKDQVYKQKRQLEKFEEKPTQKKFDTSKAFQHSNELDRSKAFHHSKENLNTTTSSTKSPLKDVNRRC